MEVIISLRQKYNKIIIILNRILHNNNKIQNFDFAKTSQALWVLLVFCHNLQIW